MATGRSPKVQGLGLEEVGVKLGEFMQQGRSVYGAWQLSDAAAAVVVGAVTCQVRVAN